jgi:uncharacterized protein
LGVLEKPRMPEGFAVFFREGVGTRVSKIAANGPVERLSITLIDSRCADEARTVTFREKPRRGIKLNIQFARLRVIFDADKNARDVAERGLSFETAADFNFDTALIGIESRCDYNEVRYVALGYLESRLHVLCFTEVEHGIRVISFRRANLRELRRYASTKGAYG